MVVTIRIGKRVPKFGMTRALHRLKGVLSFEEQLFVLMKMGFDKAMREVEKQRADGRTSLSCVREFEEENDAEPSWRWEWIVYRLSSPLRDEEVEEFEEAELMVQTALKGLIKKNRDVVKHENIAGLGTKAIDVEKYEELLRKGEKDPLTKMTLREFLLKCGIILDVQMEDLNEGIIKNA